MADNISTPSAGIEFYRCSCCTHSLSVEVDKELKEVFISVWELGLHRLSWKQRLRYCWRILRKGSPYGDHVCLDVVDARRMCTRMFSKIREIEKDEKVL